MDLTPDLPSLASRTEQAPEIPVDEEIRRRKEFSDREVGVTHPDLNSFMRFNDHGDIEIFAAPGIGMVISTRSKSISLFADSIRFYSKDDGLRWNNHNFNYAASSYSEPTLLKVSKKDIHSAQNGISYFLDRIKDFEDEETQKIVTIDGEYGFSSTEEIPQQSYKSDLDLSDLTLEQAGLVEAYMSVYTMDIINIIIKYIREGLNFDQALERSLRETKND
jgi:hypothetical protein